MHPAYDYVLKCSHAFNLMDARGLFLQQTVLDSLAVFVKDGSYHRETFAAEREALGFPLLKEK